MKYRLFSLKGLMAGFLFTSLIPAGLMAQQGDFTVKIIHPVGSGLNKCVGNTLNFIAQGYNQDGSEFVPDSVKYSWNFGYNDKTDTLETPSFTYKEGGRYTVVLSVTSKIGDKAVRKDSVDVLIGMRPSFSGTRSDHASICSGDEISLTGFATLSPMAKDSFLFPKTYTYAEENFSWEGVNGVAFFSDSNSTARINPPLDKGDLKYMFRVKDSFKCSFDTTITLYGVYASFTVSPIKGEAPLEVNMVIDSSSNGGTESDITFEWEFFENSGDTSKLLTTSDTKFTLERPGEYTSRVVAKYLQCSNFYTFEKFIKVDSSLLIIPNVFTPNGDGNNDFYQVKEAVSIKNFSGKIMNRWGRVVYEWTDSKTKEKGWDGNDMHTGQPAPPGTYYYIISAIGWDDKVYKGIVNDKKYFGFLTLIR